MSEEFNAAIQKIAEQGIYLGSQAIKIKRLENLNGHLQKQIKKLSKEKERMKQEDESNQKVIQGYEEHFKQINKWAWRRFNDLIGRGEKTEAKIIKDFIDGKYEE